MILIMAPFPSISYEYNVKELISSEVLNAVSNNCYVYSNGIHSAKTIKLLQEDPLLLSELGGISGKTIKHHLDKAKIKSDNVWISIDTPQTLKIYDCKSKSSYFINTSFECPTQKDLLKLTLKLNKHIKKVKTLIISDEFIDSCNINIDMIYKLWIEESKRNNVKVVFSTGSLNILNNVCKSVPYSIVFTESQLISLEYDISSNESIVNSLTPLIKVGIHYIAVYLRNKSAIIICRNKAYLIKSTIPLDSDCENHFGGVFLGAFAIGINRKYEIEKIGKLSLSAAMCASGNIDDPIIKRRDIEYLIKKTKVTVLNI